MGWGGKEEVRVDKWAMVLRGKNVDLGRRQSPRLFECKYEDLRRGKGAYVTAAEWTRAMRHQRSTFHHFVPILPPPLLAAWYYPCVTRGDICRDHRGPFKRACWALEVRENRN